MWCVTWCVVRKEVVDGGRRWDQQEQRRTEASELPPKLRVVLNGKDTARGEENGSYSFSRICVGSHILYVSHTDSIQDLERALSKERIS